MKSQTPTETFIPRGSIDVRRDRRFLQASVASMSTALRRKGSLLRLSFRILESIADASQTDSFGP